MTAAKIPPAPLSLYRRLQNQAAGTVQLQPGIALDFAGAKGFSYRACFLAPKDLRWESTDIVAETAPTHCFDGNNPWPLLDQSYDNVLLMNCIYLFASVDHILKEACRILRPGGLLVLTAPFLQHEIPEPVDYLRFTRSGIQAALERNGWNDIEIRPLGGRFSAIVELLRPYLLKLHLYSLAAFLSPRLDQWTRPWGRLESVNKASLGFLVTARRPAETPPR